MIKASKRLQWGRSTRAPENKELEKSGKYQNVELQWGRSTRAPENITPQFVQAGNTELQWGRSTRAPENQCGDDCGGTILKASMGPEHEGSGKYVDTLFFSPFIYASMGPEHEGSGKSRPPFIPKFGKPRFNGAGARGLRKMAPVPAPLVNAIVASMGPEHEGSGKSGGRINKKESI